MEVDPTPGEILITVVLVGTLQIYKILNQRTQLTHAEIPDTETHSEMINGVLSFRVICHTAIDYYQILYIGCIKGRFIVF